MKPPPQLVSLSLCSQGPLTECLHKSFSEISVPFTWMTWLALLSLVGLLAGHEIYAAKMSPLFEQKGNTVCFQMVLQIYWLVWYMHESMLLPISLDFSLSMGQSASMSGLFVSSGCVMCIAGIMLGKSICPQGAWNQNAARRLIIWCIVVSMIFQALEAIVSGASVHYPVPWKRLTFWLMMILSNIQQFLLALPFVPLMVMWDKVTPNSQKSFWMICTQFARQAGFILGPGALALLSSAVGSKARDVHPASLMAWVLLFNAFLALLVALLNACLLPKELVEMADDVEAEVAPEKGEDVELLEVEQRRKVVHRLTWYGFERQFVNASIEVSTIMLLEVSYKWSVERTGLVFTWISCCSLGFSVLGQRLGLSEAALFVACTLISLTGIMFLFDGTGFWGLLLADALVYGTAMVSNGLAEGWASKACGPAGSDFSTEVYRSRATSLSTAARFMAPTVARSVLDFGGRNVYAGMQGLMVGLGAATVYRVVRMVWDADAKKAREGPTN